MDNIYSKGQVARLLGLRPHQIEYRHANNQLEEPVLRFLGKRLYTPDDVRRVADHFGLALDDHLNVVAGGKATT